MRFPSTGFMIFDGFLIADGQIQPKIKISEPPRDLKLRSTYNAPSFLESRGFLPRTVSPCTRSGVCGAMTKAEGQEGEIRSVSHAGAARGDRKATQIRKALLDTRK
uniref:Transposase n=1 Tax=Steinernema glaseri TaxID=37863 RepID=A0A1I7Y7T0_9BILA